jgi:hypothetical protein
VRCAAFDPKSPTVRKLRSRLIAARTLAIALLSAANSVIRATSGKTSLNRRGTSGDQKPGHKIANAQRAAHVRFGTLCRLTSDIPEVREVPQAIITFVLACCAACRAVYSKSASSRYGLGRQNSIATNDGADAHYPGLRRGDRPAGDGLMGGRTMPMIGGDTQ